MTMKQTARETTYVDQHVGRMLRLFRTSQGLSQAELGHRAGVTFQQIQKYERGTNRIGASRLWEFCQVLGVQPGQFFDGLDAVVASEREVAESSAA